MRYGLLILINVGKRIICADLRYRASNTLITRYEHNAGTEFEPLLETVVLILQIADSQRNMLCCSCLFSLVFTSYFPIQSV